MRKRLLVAGAAVLLAGACDPDIGVRHVGWFATMRTPTSVRPYTMPLMPAPGTVPVTGYEPDSLPAAAAERLENARTRTAESLNRGEWVYGTYCAVCHGPAGAGDGSVAGPPLGPCERVGGCLVGVPSLLTAQARGRSDGYLYGVVTHAPAMGRGLMPRYGDRIRGTDRWDVVNYVRNLQAQQTTP